MTPNALIFDVDGTLAETEDAHRAAFNDTFAAHGLGWHWTRDDYRRLLKTTGGKERMRAFLAGLPEDAPRLSDAQIAALHREKTDRYAAILSGGGLALRPGVKALVARARAAGLKLAVATTTNRPNVEALTRCCWGRAADEVFEVIAAGGEVAAKKPAPDVYLLALQRLRRSAECCIAFEDSLNGLISAQAAGLRVVMAASTYTDDEDHAAAQWQVPSLEMDDLPEVLRRALSGARRISQAPRRHSTPLSRAE